MSRRVLAVAVLVALTLAGAWYVLLWSPQSSTLRQARAETAVQVKKQAPLALKVAELQHEQVLLPGLRAQLGVLNTAIPVVPVIDNVIDGINGMSRAAGVNLLSLTPAPASTSSAANAASPAGPTAIRLTLSVHGSYAQIIDFVNRLSATPRLMVVDTLGFGLPDSAGNIAVSVGARVFTAPAS